MIILKFKIVKINNIIFDQISSGDSSKSDLEHY